LLEAITSPGFSVWYLVLVHTSMYGQGNRPLTQVKK
jgi:hypothetical protein